VISGSLQLAVKAIRRAAGNPLSDEWALVRSDLKDAVGEGSRLNFGKVKPWLKVDGQPRSLARIMNPFRDIP
jgi:hypothetical protein